MSECPGNQTPHQLRVPAAIASRGPFDAPSRPHPRRATGTLNAPPLSFAEILPAPRWNSHPRNRHHHHNNLTARSSAVLFPALSQRRLTAPRPIQAASQYTSVDLVTKNQGGERQRAAVSPTQKLNHGVDHHPQPPRRRVRAPAWGAAQRDRRGSLSLPLPVPFRRKMGGRK